MPVLETDFLKGLVDVRDRLHIHSVRALAKVMSDGWAVASSSLLELDLILKNANIALPERHDIFESLKAEFDAETVLPLSHAVLSQAALLQLKYPIPKFYFDSIHVSTAVLHDGEIVSSDREFDQITEVRRIPLEKL
jgi:PIN domain nuclease of toxin-antitoxin system